MLTTIRAIRNAQTEEEAIQFLHAYELEIEAQTKRWVISQIARHAVSWGTSALSDWLEHFLDGFVYMPKRGIPVPDTQRQGAMKAPLV